MRISVRSRSDHFHVVFYAREILWLKIYPFLKQSGPISVEHAYRTRLTTVRALCSFSAHLHTCSICRRRSSRRRSMKR